MAWKLLLETPLRAARDWILFDAMDESGEDGRIVSGSDDKTVRMISGSATVDR
eukprot:gene26975-35680_t